MTNTHTMNSRVKLLAIRLRSSAAGRERWDVPCVCDHPAWAATVETIIGSEEGIEFVFANPVTGRVLV
jgi:hypothetical protein